MKNLIKPFLITSLMALPLFGSANASPMWGMPDADQAREELRVNRMQYETAVKNKDFDRARFEKMEIDKNLGQLSEYDTAVQWDTESENHYLLTEPQESNSYSRRIIYTTPYNASNQTMTRVWDPLSETYYTVPVTP